MPIKADYHLHSSFSGDSQTPMKQMIERGIELGLSTMCFTEHIDMDYPYDKKEDEGMFDLNTYSYLYDLACAKGNYADKIKILFGIEIGVQPHLAFKLAEYAMSAIIRIRIIRPFLKAVAMKRPIGNIFLRLWTIWKRSLILMFMAIWTM